MAKRNKSPLPHDDFYPANDRERDILRHLLDKSYPSLLLYIEKRNKGMTVTESLDFVMGEYSEIASTESPILDDLGTESKRPSNYTI